MTTLTQLIYKVQLFHKCFTLGRSMIPYNNYEKTDNDKYNSGVENGRI